MSKELTVEEKYHLLIQEYQTLFKRHEQLVRDVRVMRGHQTEFFRYRASSDLKIAKRWQKVVDNRIQEEVTIMQSLQGNLFK